jgi:hypothetical protein
MTEFVKLISKYQVNTRRSAIESHDGGGGFEDI